MDPISVVLGKFSSYQDRPARKRTSLKNGSRCISDPIRFHPAGMNNPKSAGMNNPKSQRIKELKNQRINEAEEQEEDQRIKESKNQTGQYRDNIIITDSF